MAVDYGHEHCLAVFAWLAGWLVGVRARGMQPQPPSYTDEQVKELESFYANATSEWHQYVPMIWSTASATSMIAAAP